VAKGAVAAGVGLASGNRAVGVACGLAAVLGHVYPVTRRVRGGKGVATGAGMALVLLPGVALVLAAVWLVATKVFRAASAGSVLVAVGFPVGAWLVGRPPGEIAAFAVGGLLIVARHRENLDRLWRGEERTLTPGRRG
jgi:glycerol-3-phosphate acyltransferase PlsY